MCASELQNHLAMLDKTTRLSRKVPAVSLIARLLTSTGPCLQVCCTAAAPSRMDRYIFGYACTHWKRQKLVQHVCLPPCSLPQCCNMRSTVDNCHACMQGGWHVLFSCSLHARSGPSKQCQGQTSLFTSLIWHAPSKLHVSLPYACCLD